MLNISSEVAVIGSGPGGAITAWRLAKGGVSVALLEEGSSIIPDAYPSYGLLDMETKYRQGGMTFATGKPNVSYVEAQVVGGGSEVNSGLYYRTPEVVLERWRREYDLQSCDAKTLDPLFEECERKLRIQTQPESDVAEEAIRLRRGAEAKKWAGGQVPRWIEHGRRHSMSNTFIPEAIAAGANLRSGYRVEIIRPSPGGGWIITGRTRAGQRFIVTCATVFMCAGAIQSAYLLRKNKLSRLAGQTLHMHPSLKIVAEYAEPFEGDRRNVADYQIKEFAPHMSFGSSISSPGHSAVALGTGALVNGQSSEAWAKRAVYYAMIEGDGAGRVGAPLFVGRPSVSYRLGSESVRELRLATNRLADVLFAGGARTLYLSGRDNQVLSREAVTESKLNKLDVSALRLMTIHLFSTCPMGEDRRRCVTDSFGRVHGQAGLYVNDASLLCTAPSVNPQGSVMAFAMRNANHFLEQRRSVQ